MNKNYCMNCGKYGHCNKICKEPITSCGIICFKLNNLPIRKIENYLSNKYINIDDFNYKNLNYINKINLYKNNIKFLLIQRKHSLSFIQFLRGKYNENEEDIIKLFNLMTIDEVNSIKNNDFNYLWNNLWLKTATNKIYLKEKSISKIKFEKIKNSDIINNLKSHYKEPEWGFPKGRRNRFENNLDCANREFQEETDLTDYILLNKINSIEETFSGTDNVLYKHIYYIAGCNENFNSNINQIEDNFEISNAGWFTLDEVINKFREYNNTRKNVINQVYYFLLILIDKISNKNIPINYAI